MISWKYSFETSVKELEMVRRKKQALDSLVNTGKISASTYEHLNKEISNAITAIEADQKALTEKMTLRANELEKQIKSLEVFLANLEIHHAAGEINEEAYKNQSDAITLGLEITKQEQNDIKEALVKLIPETPAPTSTEEQSEPQEIPTEAPIEEAQETAEATTEATPE